MAQLSGQPRAVGSAGTAPASAAGVASALVPGAYPPEVEGREGGRQGGRGPAPGSAWVKFRATQVLGESAAGVFSSLPPEYVYKENHEQEQEAEEVERMARHFGGLAWPAQSVLAPDFAVLREEPGPAFRAELYIFVRQVPEADSLNLKEVRVRGPPRRTLQEARKDGCELKLEAFRSAHGDPGTLDAVRVRLRELQVTEWQPEDLTAEETDESVERRLPEFTTATQAEKFKEQQQSVSSLREWIYAKQEVATESFVPVGPSWSRAGQATAVPRLPGVWYVHERQSESGRPLPWMFFNASSGKYYRAPLGEVGKWTQTGTPHKPVTHPVTVAHGAVCTPSSSGRKDDLAVALPELARTGSALRQPLPFLDKPAALYLLTDGLRNTTAGAEFCAKRFHAQFLPRLSSRSTDLEDHELLTILTEALESLDQALLESSARYAGCGFALALVLGRRLVVGTLGECRVALCRPQSLGKAAGGSEPWQARILAGGVEGRTADVLAAEGRRLSLAKAPLDLHATKCLGATSASAEELAAQPDEQERLLIRVARAAHPFAALGLAPADVMGGVAAVKRALDDFEDVAHPSKVRSDLERLATTAHARIREAAEAVETMMGMDVYVTQLLAELYTMMDEENGIPTPKRAAALLGVEPGCGEAAAEAGIDRRYRAVISQLAAVSPEQSARGFQILAEVADAAARPVAPVIWTPPGDRVARVTRALGFRDLKRPRRLMGHELALEVVRLEAGTSLLMLLTDGARGISEARLGEIAALHRDRPRATCLRLTAEGQATSPDEAVGSIAVKIRVADPSEDSAMDGATAATSSTSKPSDPKKRKAGEALGPGGKEPGKPARIRVAHVLLKYVGLEHADVQARRPAPAGRTQADAERELLDLLEALQKGDLKDLANRFTAAVREKSDCKSALNTPHADLGWVNPGQFGKEFDAAAFELKAGTLSDIVLTPRGAHVLYRLA